jgi:hypothetical protein
VENKARRGSEKCMVAGERFWGALGAGLRTERCCCGFEVEGDGVPIDLVVIWVSMRHAELSWCRFFLRLGCT